MGDRPVTALWGIGERTARRLAELGIHTVGELAGADHHELARAVRPTIGPNLKVLGLGGDDAPIVDEPHVARSAARRRPSSATSPTGPRSGEQVGRLATEVTESVVAEGRRVTHVAVKVRTPTFFTRTKISKLPEPTTDPAEVARMAHVVLGRFELDPPGPAARRPGGARDAVDPGDDEPSERTEPERRPTMATSSDAGSSLRVLRRLHQPHPRGGSARRGPQASAARLPARLRGCGPAVRASLVPVSSGRRS